MQPRPYCATTIRDEANSDRLVELVGREFEPDGAEPIGMSPVTESALF